MKISRLIESCADEELASSLLRDAQFHTVFDLRMDLIPKLTGFGLNFGKIHSSRSAPDPEDVLHYKDLRFEVTNKAEKLLIQPSSRIFLQSPAMIRPIPLPGSTEALARRSTDNEIDVAGSD